MSFDKHNFHLKHDAHWHAMSRRFKGMQVSSNLVDVTLSCEGRKITAHRMILSACSSYFSNIFEVQNAKNAVIKSCCLDNPCKHPVIIFRNILFSDLEALVEFMYTGEVSVSQENLDTFLSTADTLQVQGLIQMSSSILPAAFIQNCETQTTDSVLVNSTDLRASVLKEQTPADKLQFSRTIVADACSISTADEFALDRINNCDDYNCGSMEIPSFQETPAEDPLLIDHTMDGIGNKYQAIDLQQEDVNEDLWSNELKFKPTALTASVKVKVKTETNLTMTPRLKIRPCSDIDDKPGMQKLLARNKKFGHVEKSRYKIETEKSSPSRMQPPRMKKAIKKKCLDNNEQIKKIRLNKNKVSPSKNIYRNRGITACKTKSGTRKRSIEVQSKIRKSSGNCPVCRKFYKYSAALQNHVLIEHHLIPSVDQWRSLSCMKCNESFNSRKGLIDHLFGNHYNTIVCTVCKKIFSSKKMMKNHFIDRHVLEQ